MEFTLQIVSLYYRRMRDTYAALLALSVPNQPTKHREHEDLQSTVPAPDRIPAAT